MCCGSSGCCAAGFVSCADATSLFLLFAASSAADVKAGAASAAGVWPGTGVAIGVGSQNPGGGTSQRSPKFSQECSPVTIFTQE